MTGGRRPGAPRVTVAADQHGRTLISFVKRYMPGVPLSGLHKMMRTGRIRVNEGRAKPDLVLAAGDEITFRMADADFSATRHRDPARAAPSEASLGPLRVLVETEDWIAVEKPAGLLTHAGDPAAAHIPPRPPEDTLVDRVVAHEARRGSRATFPPAPVHRLDRGTSGVVVFARTARGARQWSAAFREGTARKTYLGVVQGQAAEGTLESLLIRDERSRTSRAETPESGHTRGRLARMDVQVLASVGDASLVLARPASGRTHQIRAQLAAAGTPLLGDVKYGGRPLPGRPGYLLHAWKLSIPGATQLICPVPEDWGPVLADLGLPEPSSTEPIPTPSAASGRGEARPVRRRPRPK